MTSRSPVQIILSGATVLSHTLPAAPGYPQLPTDEVAARGSAVFLTDQAIGVSAGAIAWVVPSAEVTAADRGGAQVIDAAGQVAIPGLVNCHTHAAMTVFRGSAEDVPTHAWFNEHIWPMEVNLTRRDVELGAELAVAEMLLAGVTTFADHYFEMPAIAAVVERTGARALLAQTFFSSQGQAGLETSAAFAAEFDGAAGGRIATALGPHATYTVTDDDLAATAQRAHELGVLTHIHAAESPAQTTSSLAVRGITPIGVLDRTGLLGAGVVIAHGAGIVEADLPLLAAHADRVGVAACDKVYLKHAQSGTTPVRLLHDAGITVGVGTDGPASHNTLDVLESLRFLALTEKDRHSDATWLTSAHALDLATRQSATALGFGDRLGALLPGYRADIVLIDLAGPHLQPMHDLAAALVLSVKSSDVTTVLVDGQVVVRDRRLVLFDPAETIAELNARVPQLRDTCHGRRIQDYAP